MADLPGENLATDHLETHGFTRDTLRRRAEPYREQQPYIDES